VIQIDEWTKFSPDECHTAFLRGLKNLFLGSDKNQDAIELRGGNKLLLSIC